MATTVERPKEIAQQMLDKKRRIQEYLKSGDETKKPAGVKFVKPFTVPAEGQ
ncbi:hypothetical protein [Spirosoma fluviale]|uniref:hypothetical protein n=1 Tax=Spirosoma fluviale TaxID=1597977 RepID=UPI0015C99911|nr:hypothetical protein [Spirosoma fluviale]